MTKDKMEQVIEYISALACGTKLSLTSIMKELGINTTKIDMEDFYYELIEILELEYNLIIDMEESDEPWKKRGTLRHIYKFKDCAKPLAVDSFTIISNKLGLEEMKDNEPVEQRLAVEMNGLVKFVEYNYSGEVNREISRNFDAVKISKLVSELYTTVKEHEDANLLLTDCGYFDIRFYVADDIYEFSGSMSDSKLSCAVNALLTENIGITGMWGI